MRLVVHGNTRQSAIHTLSARLHRAAGGIRNGVALLALASGLLLLSGCVTTVEGTTREVGTPEERVRAHIDLARGYLEEGNYLRARAPLEKALAVDSTSVEAHVLKAIVHQREEENALAETHYRSALSHDPDNAQALNNFGSFLFAQGRVEEAIVPLRKAVDDPAYQARGQAYENLGLVELSLDNVEAAQAAFSRALMLGQRQPRSSLELAALYYDQGNYVLATEYYTQFRNAARQTPRSLCLGMQLAGALGASDELASYTLALRNLYPGSAEASDCEVRGGQ